VDIIHGYIPNISPLGMVSSNSLNIGRGGNETNETWPTKGNWGKIRKLDEPRKRQMDVDAASKLCKLTLW
jgi:hypothetical protein